ncbi:hypothetical protein IFM89_011343 [Coptis chinensis]|uniref:Tim44-like domain-containing protein n=1 Tax=Coptis chinensis TaxID=261450 RepID=A0A835HLV5_9MAGN|nr:hypothetical protein IFM89_011343 [Coptis chinensis]
MGSRKLVRDFILSKQLLHHLQPQQQVVRPRLPLLLASRVQNCRRFSVLDEFSKKVKGEVESNPEFQKSIKDLKEKAEQSRERRICTSVWPGAWTEAEATAKKVSANVKEKISAATEEVKETLGLGKQGSSGSTASTAKSGTDAKVGDPTSEEAKSETSFSSDSKDSLFEWFKSSLSFGSPKISFSFQKLKDIKVIDYAKKGYDMVKDELSSNPSKKRRLRYEASSSSTEERSTSTDIVVVPIKQSRLNKKWEALKEKLNGHPVVKRLRGISEPVVTKSQEFAEDVREQWETSDNRVIHKIQDLNETVFGETQSGLTFKEIRRIDPYFSLPDFVAEVEEMVRPTLNAFIKGDVEVLKKNCSPEVIERYLAERRAYENQGIFFDNKILHISEVEVKETKLMGNTPMIIVLFQTQQIFCVRDKEGSIKEGGEDTIQCVIYAWAMQLLDVEEQGEGALNPIWRLREMHQQGVTALI